MDFRRALNELGLKLPTTPYEIEERYKILANQRHPDRGGTHETMTALNNAKDVALASLESHGNLVPQEAIAPLVATLASLEEHRRLTEKLENSSEQLRLRSTNKLRRLRIGAAVCAAVFFAAIFVRQELPLEIVLPSRYTILYNSVRDIFPETEAGVDQLNSMIFDSIDGQNDATNAFDAVTSSYMKALDIDYLINEGFLQYPTFNEYKITLERGSFDEVEAMFDRIASEVMNKAKSRKEFPSRYRDRVLDAENDKRVHLERQLATIFFGVTSIFGVAIWILFLLVNHVESQLLILQNQVSSRTQLHKLLKEILGRRIDKRWTLQEMEMAVSKWRSSVRGYRRVVKAVGFFYFAQFIMDHAQRIDLVSVQSEMEDGYLVEYYMVTASKDRQAHP